MPVTTPIVAGRRRDGTEHGSEGCRKRVRQREGRGADEKYEAAEAPFRYREEHEGAMELVSCVRSSVRSHLEEERRGGGGAARDSQAE